MNYFTRLIQLKQRILWLAPLMGGVLPAVNFCRKASRNLDHVGHGRYGHAPFIFRGLDMMALKEVFVDAEYSPIISRLGNNVEPVVLDVGAHIGAFGIWLLDQAPRARVFSVEADLQTFGILQRNADILKAEGALWNVVNKAAWKDENHVLRFSNVGWSMGHRVSQDGDLVVEGITLEKIMRDVAGTDGVIDLMKVDIEGSEEAFLCAQPDLLRRVRCVVIELHDKLCNTERVLDTLRLFYEHVDYISGRSSPKPLLMCYSEFRP